MHSIGTGLAILAVASTAAAQEVHSIGPVSFVVPGGMTYAEEGDHAAMTRVVGDSIVPIAISVPVPSAGDPEASFKAVWTRITQTAPPLLGYTLFGNGGGYTTIRSASRTTSSSTPDEAKRRSTMAPRSSGRRRAVARRPMAVCSTSAVTS